MAALNLRGGSHSAAQCGPCSSPLLTPIVMEINIHSHCQVDPFARPRQLADQVSRVLDQQTSAQRQACIESAIQHSPQQHFVGHINTSAVSFNVQHPSGQCEAFAQPTEPSDRPTVIYRNRKRQRQLTEMAQTRPWLFMGLKLVLRMRQFWRNQTKALNLRFGTNPSKRRDGNARRARRH